MSRVKTVTQTFRFDAETHDGLMDEAKRQGVSMNVLVGQVLQDFTVWGRFVGRAGIISLGPPVIASLLAELSDEQLESIGAKLGKHHPRDVLANLKLPVTLENIKRVIEDFLCKKAHWFETCELMEQGDGSVLNLRHGLNRKWSVFLYGYMVEVLLVMNYRKIEAYVDDFTVRIDVIKKE